MSANGRYVAFQSSASNLVSEDTNGDPDIFVHDIQTGETIRVSVDSNGTQVSAGASYPVISAEGRYVAFESLDSNLVSEDTNGDRDIFLHDTVTEATTRVSVTSNGIQANAESWYPAISADGRYVAFESWASNLVNGDTNGYRDIFLHDTQTGATIRVSIASDGTQADGGSMYPVISADGRYVAFRSYASNLVSGDTNGNPDIFLHDTQTGETVRISVDSNGTEANGNQVSPAISADGRYVAFDSDASNLVNDDTNGVNDIFLHDTENGETIRVSVGSNGMQGNDHSWKRPAVSADGRFVVFESDANNLVSGDTNGGSDIFLHNTETGETIRVSVDIEGTQGNGLSGYPTISADGRYVAFYSDASNLVSEDTNGARDVFLRDTQVGHAALWLSQPQLHSQAD
ncbi:MAG: PD40 domain-containing protein [Ardenticatenaceae bacterium]|nr:PD40 domain-containing protein [Ardenticatenaceae bacterium]